MDKNRIREWSEETWAKLCINGSATAESDLASAAASLISEVRREVLSEAAKVVLEMAEPIIRADVEWHSWDKHGHGDNARSYASALLQLAEREGER